MLQLFRLIAKWIWKVDIYLWNFTRVAYLRYPLTISLEYHKVYLRSTSILESKSTLCCTGCKRGVRSATLTYFECFASRTIQTLISQFKCDMICISIISDHIREVISHTRTNLDYKRIIVSKIFAPFSLVFCILIFIKYDIGMSFTFLYIGVFVGHFLLNNNNCRYYSLILRDTILSQKFCIFQNIFYTRDAFN